MPRPLSSIHAAISCGICSDVIRKVNITALVMMYSSIALMFAESSSTFGTLDSGMSL